MSWDWMVGGINTTVPRNAGPECANYLNARWRYIETTLVILFAVWLMKWSYPKLSLSAVANARNDRSGRRILLIVTCITLGMEIAYKFATRTVIDLLHPCHLTSVAQIYLLAAAPSKTVTAVFRLHLNWLNGPFLAYIFPETDTRVFPMQCFVYWVQHGLLFVVPYYLLRLGGVYNIEGIWDMSWSAMSYALNLIYHFLFLQEIAIPTQVNLSHMLCPALSDPFAGQLYRVATVMHEGFLCPFLCKSYCLIAEFFLTKFEPTKVKSTLSSELTSYVSNRSTSKVDIDSGTDSHEN